MPSLFSNFLNSPSLISPQCSPASSLLLSLLFFSPWVPPPRLPLSLCFTGGRTASSRSHHMNPLVYCSFWFLPDEPRPWPLCPSHFIPETLESFFVLLPLSPGFTVAPAHSSMLHLWSYQLFVFFFFFFSFLFGGSPLYFWSFSLTPASLSFPNQCTWSHLSYLHCLNTKLKGVTWSSLGFIVLENKSWQVWWCGILDLFHITEIIWLSGFHHLWIFMCECVWVYF